ncbi:Ada metal-binding domain-containing protein [Lentibacillus populi]|uniref:Ada metal-binding domain-containing protein n=1 Tax=Lentibacillus populi TaxID=1827502 RepID=UPI003530D4D6
MTTVKTTKIYCRSNKPKKMNIEFFVDIQKVEAVGYRPCKRRQAETIHQKYKLIYIIHFVLANNSNKKCELS